MITESVIKNPRLDADTPWKNILDVYFREFMEFCLPNVASQINWQRGFISLDKELQKIYRESQVKNGIVDKLIKVWRVNGTEAWLLIHLEVQGFRVINFPKRMFIYRYRIFDRYQVPIIGIALLADDDVNWRPDCYREEIFGCSLEMRYLIIKILDYSGRRQELEKMHNPFAMIILAQLSVLETRSNSERRLVEKINLTRQLFSHGWRKNQIMEVFKFIDWLIALPEEFKLEYHQSTQYLEEEKSMAYVSTAEWVGVQKGMQQGMQQGVQQAMRRLLIRRFGQIPPEYLHHIEKANAETLWVWYEKILDVTTIDEIFITNG